MALFDDEYPSLDNYWRSIILFGKNVASYKFALAKSLIDLLEQNKASVSYEELAEPFSRHICEHLQLADKQGTSGSSRFLESCRKFNANDLTKEELVTSTAKLGFVNVIDAFHVVNDQPVPVRFFEERPDKKGIDLTDDIYRLKQLSQFQNLPLEAESRWRLVETAWQLNISRNLITVSHDADKRLLFVEDRSLRRVAITSSRSALNGYQKGKCFYCFADICVLDGQIDADVDHFFPHALKQHGFDIIDGVWNLVLACDDCNRGPGGKFAKIPETRFLERLHKRNEFLISSHHPLRQTLIQQTGSEELDRIAFMRSYNREAVNLLLHSWKPANEHDPAV